MSDEDRMTVHWMRGWLQLFDVERGNRPSLAIHYGGGEFDLIMGHCIGAAQDTPTSS